MKKSAIISALFTMMLVLTSFSTPNEIGGRGQVGTGSYEIGGRGQVGTGSVTIGGRGQVGTGS